MTGPTRRNAQPRALAPALLPALPPTLLTALLTALLIGPAAPARAQDAASQDPAAAAAAAQAQFRARAAARREAGIAQPSRDDDRALRDLETAPPANASPASASPVTGASAAERRLDATDRARRDRDRATDSQRRALSDQIRTYGRIDNSLNRMGAATDAKMRALRD